MQDTSPHAAYVFGYFDDLSRRVRQVALLFAGTFVLSLFFVSSLVRMMVDQFALESVALVVTTPFQLFSLTIDLSFFIATAFTIPFAIWSVYAFLRAGLTRREARLFRVVVPLSVLLFVSGCVFGGFSLYLGLQFMAAQAAIFGLQNFWDISIFLSQIIWTSALLGVIFQFPIVLAFLIRAGVISVQYVTEMRPFFYTLVMLSVALLPPSDGLSLVIMSVPLFLLFECTLFVYRGYR